MSDSDRVVPLHPAAPEISPEERMCRLQAEVERLTRLPDVERVYYVESDGYAEKYGTNKDALRKMVNTVIKERRQAEERDEKQQGLKQRERERREEKQQQRDRQAKKDEQQRDRQAKK